MTAKFCPLIGKLCVEEDCVFWKWGCLIADYLQRRGERET